MQTTGKVILIGSVLIVAAASVFYLLPDNKSKAKDPAKLVQTVQVPTPNVTPHRHPGKERMLATLKDESLDQSIKLLIDDREQYFFPFRPSDLNIGGGQEDLEQMLSTRRSVKVLQEIKELPQSKGDEKCEVLFSTAFQLHTNICRAMIRYVTDPSAPTNNRSVLGPKMGMAAAMFIAADTARLGVLEKQFVKLDQWRDEIKPLANLTNRIIPFLPALTVVAIAPDFRLQVNVLRLAALRSGDAKMLKEVDEACAGIQMTTNTIPIMAWNAETTAFELLPDSPLDTSKGVTAYTFYDWNFKMAVDYANSIFDTNSDELPGIKDEQLFVKKLESIVFKGITSP